MKTQPKSKRIKQEDLNTFRSALIRAIDWEESLADAWAAGTTESIKATETAAHFRSTRDRLFPEHRDVGKWDGEVITIQELSRRGGAK